MEDSGWKKDNWQHSSNCQSINNFQSSMRPQQHKQLEERKPQAIVRSLSTGVKRRPDKLIKKSM
jgi:hypothetical protein